MRRAGEAQRAWAKTVRGAKAQVLYDIDEAVAREAEALTQVESRTSARTAREGRGRDRIPLLHRRT